jgi:hypothetical protein
MNTFTTNKGTELPILNLKGKDYLQVAHRLVWFREECPRYRIETEFTQLTEKHAFAKATIKNDSGEIMATAHKREDAGHFGDYAEKAETGAIGRALAYCGYGTQFCADEIDEGERIVDAPLTKVEIKNEKKVSSVVIKQEAQTLPIAANSPVLDSTPISDKLAAPQKEYIVSFGKKYKGKTFKEMSVEDIASFSMFLQNSAAEQGKEMNAQASEYVKEADAYLKNIKRG